jgi:hypothetical protein
VTTTVVLASFDDTLAVNRGKAISSAYIQSSRSIAQRVLVFLEGRRVLHGSRSADDEDHCRRSADEIRRRLEPEIVAGSGPLQDCLRKMRRAAVLFVGHAGPDARHFTNHPAEFRDALDALRDAFGPEVGWLASSYGIDIEPQLAEIIPGARIV